MSISHPSSGVLPGGSDTKESVCSVGDPSLIPGLGRSPGEGNGNPLQYSCLENSMNGEAWRATVHGVAKSWTQLSDFPFFSFSFTEISDGEEMATHSSILSCLGNPMDRGAWRAIVHGVAKSQTGLSD